MAKNLINKNNLLIILILAGTFLLINTNSTGALITNLFSVQGQFTSASCTSLQGWACHPSWSTASLTIKVYEGSTLIATTSANKYLPSIASQCKNNPNHGFTITTPTSLKNNVPHSLTVYAVDPFKNINVKLSGSPKSITCVAPASCTDNIKNQDETDIDCGGSTCTTRCSVTQTCITTSDCILSTCISGVCSNQPIATCTDGIKNGAETDVDCGGPTCQKCSPGKSCLINQDCLFPSSSTAYVSGACAGYRCTYCIDSDYGPISNVAGNASVHNGTVTFYNDVCINSTYVREYTCPSWSGVASYDINCAVPTNATSNTSTTQCSAARCI